MTPAGEIGGRRSRLALQEFSRERVPLMWAETQANLGDALSSLGARDAGTELLEEAVVAWNTSLPVIESAWPPERIQRVRSRRDEVQADIKRRATK